MILIFVLRTFIHCFEQFVTYLNFQELFEKTTKYRYVNFIKRFPTLHTFINKILKKNHICITQYNSYPLVSFIFLTCLPPQNICIWLQFCGVSQPRAHIDPRAGGSSRYPWGSTSVRVAKIVRKINRFAMIIASQTRVQVDADVKIVCAVCITSRV